MDLSRGFLRGCLKPMDRLQLSLSPTRYLAAVQEEPRQLGPAEEALWPEQAEAVGVEVDRGGVHGDLARHGGEAAARAPHQVHSPRLGEHY